MRIITLPIRFVAFVLAAVGGVVIFTALALTGVAGYLDDRARGQESYYYTFATLILVALLTLLMLTGCASVAGEIIVNPLHTRILYAHIEQDTGDIKKEAYTGCDSDNEPLIVMDTSLNRPDPSKFTLTHEWRHVVQFKAFKGGCRKALEWYNANPWNRLQWEMEAECYALASRKWDEELFERRVNLYFGRNKFPRLEYQDLEDRFRRVCLNERLHYR